MDHRFRIEPLVFLATAAAILILPLDWLISAFLAASFHELCHYLAIRILGYKIWRLTVRLSGASMLVPEMGRGAELICAAAGPMGSLSLLLLARWYPKLAVCGFVQGVFNLLPVYPLDGGRILRCVTSEKLYRNVQWIFGVISAFLGVYLIKYSIIPLLLLTVAAIRLLERKIPCKDG